MAKSIETSVKFMESIAKDDSHGYAQDNRSGNPDFDCSSFVGTALNKGGFNVKTNSTTRTLYDQLIAEDFKVIKDDSDIKRGDIWLTPGKHVVMSTDASHIVHASINEKGTTTKGKEGDQTGKEICIRTFYKPSYGWKYHLRYEVKNYLSKGDKGADVKEMQTKLIYCGFSCGKHGADSYFGDDTYKALKAFQKAYGLTQDGKYGVKSKAKLISVYNSKKEETNKYYKKYTGKSTQIDVVFKAIGVPEKYRGNWAHRKPVAVKNGIANYTGKASENGKLISYAKTGKLKKA